MKMKTTKRSGVARFNIPFRINIGGESIHMKQAILSEYMLSHVFIAPIFPKIYPFAPIFLALRSNFPKIAPRNFK
jgi:hypothetical protein